MAELIYKSTVDVSTVQSCGGDHMVVAAARVCTTGSEACQYSSPENAAESGGLINYLMKHRHGCYDKDTEVLTDRGWLKWPDVTGEEKFVTLSPTGEIEYQAAERLVSVPYDGDMLRIKGNLVDAFVTPNHNMWAKRRTHHGSNPYTLVAAAELETASHRLQLGGGEWKGEDSSVNEESLAKYRLVGFFIGDGHGDGKVFEFHLRRPHKIKWLREQTRLAGIRLREGKSDKYILVPDADMQSLMMRCYTEDRKKRIPEGMLSLPSPLLFALREGLMRSDGHVSAKGKRTYSTTSYLLAGQIQELALKLGEAATLRLRRKAKGNHSALYTLTFLRKTSLFPKVGWTTTDRKRHVQRVPYTGNVYCVTVPNGTLYVRRNGYPMWCGNSPFEHGSITFYVHAPLFVWREWHRHRIGFSYNEESARYKQLEPVFYIPARNRPMMKVEGWKPGRPKFTVCETDEVYEQLCNNLKKQYRSAYEAYECNLALGVDPGLARDCLPVGIYSGCWVTCNPRSLMAFLSLRTHEPAADKVSYPLWEIEIAARKCEEALKQYWPLTYAAFVANGRAAP